MLNKYICEARISELKFRELVTMFRADVPALTASRLTLVNRRTSQRVYVLLRKRVVEIAKEGVRSFTSEVEIDESDFDARRVRGRRGRRAAGKTPVIGLLKRSGKVFTSVVANCSRAALEPVIKGQVLSKSTVYTGGWLGYDGLLSRASRASGALPSFASQNCRACERSFPFFISKNLNGVGNHRRDNLFSILLKTCASNRCNLGKILPFPENETVEVAIYSEQ